MEIILSSNLALGIFVLGAENGNNETHHNHIKEFKIARKRVSDYILFNWDKAYDAIRLLRFRRARCPDCGELIGYALCTDGGSDGKYEEVFILACSVCGWACESQSWSNDLREIESLPCDCDFGKHKYKTILNRKVCIRCGEWK